MVSLSLGATSIAGVGYRRTSFGEPIEDGKMPVLRASCCNRVCYRRGLQKRLMTATLCTLGMHLRGAHSFGHGLHQFARMSRGCADDDSCRKGDGRASWVDLLGRGPSVSVERYVAQSNGGSTEVGETRATNTGDTRRRQGRRERSRRGGRDEGSKRRGRSIDNQQQQQRLEKGDYAMREMLLVQMKMPKTRRQGLVAMWESDLRLRAHEYSALLTAACQLGWAAMASAIMEEMVQDGLPLEAKTYGLAVKAACRADNVRLALLLIMDQYARWREGVFIEQSEASAMAESGVSAPRSRGGIRMSDIKQHFPKVLAVTLRTGDMEGSLETLKYMSAMGVEATPGICQSLISTAFKAGGEHLRRVPAMLRAMGEMNVASETSLLEMLRMLHEANSPESALYLLLDVSRGDGDTGLSKSWRPEQCGPEALAFLMEHSLKMGRLDVVGIAIQELLSNLPRALYERTTSAEFVSNGGVAITNPDAPAGSFASVPSINGQGKNSGGNTADGWGFPRIIDAETLSTEVSEAVGGNGSRDLEKRLEVEKVAAVLNSVLALLAKSSSGHTAAALLDQWRAITLGGVWAGGDVIGVGTETETLGNNSARDARTIARYGKPTEASYRLTMAALVRSGQWGRARSLLEVMRADGVRPSTGCISTLLMLLLERVEPTSTLTSTSTSTSTSSVPSNKKVVNTQDSALPFVSNESLWAKSPAYAYCCDWEEVVSLVREARSTEGVTVTRDMYLTALSVLPPIAKNPKPVSLGVESSAPPPPASVFLENAERLVGWAREDGVAMTSTLLYPVVQLAHIARDASKVVENFEQMLEVDTTHNESLPMYADAYKMALDACAFGNDPERALSYVHGMRLRSCLRPSAIHFEKAVIAMATAERFRDAYQLLAVAVEDGSARVEVYDAAIRAAALEGNSGQAETILRVMIDMGIKPRSETLSQLILTYGACGDVDGLCSVMARATSRAFPGSVLNALVYETLLKVLIPLEAWQEAEAFVKEAERLLPGSLTYRTYGYLMVAYAVENQWGAAIDLATGIGRWPESSTDLGGRFHPPELRETACAVALKWLLTPEIDPEVNEGVFDVGVGVGGRGNEEGAVERVLRHRHGGRTLFVRLLAAGAPLKSVRVIEASLGGAGKEAIWSEAMSSWEDTEDGFTATEASSDWLVSSLPKDDAEREVSAQALHVSTVLEVLLRTYATSDQPVASDFHSPAAVGLLQQGVSAACAADDPDLAERLFEAWLGHAGIDQPWNTRMRTALRASLSRVLAGFFEGEGKLGVFRGLALMERCRDTGLLPFPRDLLAAMRACNAAGLFSLALNMFDEIFTASDSDSTDPGSPPVKSNRAISGTPNDLQENTPAKNENEDADGDGLGGVPSGMVGGWSQILGGVEQDVPDGELLPAAAATVALESCFLGGNRDRAMGIVWQLIRRRHPLTESCRNRAIVALTEGGKPDMALDMARGMEIEDHYTDRATLDFVEKFLEKAFSELQEDKRRRNEKGSKTGEWSNEEEQAWDVGLVSEDNDESMTENGVRRGRIGEDSQNVTLGVGVPLKVGNDWGEEFDSEDGLSATGDVPAGGVREDRRPSELVLRFLPLLSEALRNRLRPEEDHIDGGVSKREEELTLLDDES